MTEIERALTAAMDELGMIGITVRLEGGNGGIAAEMYDMAGRYLTAVRIHGTLMLTCEDDIMLLAMRLKNHLLAWAGQHRYRR